MPSSSSEIRSSCTSRRPRGFGVGELLAIRHFGLMLLGRRCGGLDHHGGLRAVSLPGFDPGSLGLGDGAAGVEPRGECRHRRCHCGERAHEREDVVAET